MPELPEVETIKLGLQKYLIGHKILTVDIRVNKILHGDKRNILGAKVAGIQRAGKGLLIMLDNGYALAIHLKLTGQLIYQGKETENTHLSPKTGGHLPSKYTRAIFNLDKNAHLFFNDLRMFGWIKVVKKDEIKSLDFFKGLGPEPPVVPSKAGTMEGQAPLTVNKFNDILFKSSRPIKLILMDQKKIAGIGNIYANEALFVAGIDPRKKANSLKSSEIKKLYDAVIEVLKKGLKYGGSSDVNYVNALGTDGQYQHHFLVYGRTGAKCHNCEDIVTKIQLGGRGTYFCPKCQR